VVLLPAMTRYEQPGGGTSTTTERRIAFSPEVPGPRPGEARPEWWIFTEVARRAAPDRAALVGCEDAGAIRREIAEVVPLYAGIDGVAETGDQVQWGGARLCDGWVFPTPDGRAHFVPVEPRGLDLPPGRFLLSTRRGKQFNSMVFKEKDPLTGAGRDALFMSADDAAALGLAEDATVVVRSETGEMAARVKLAPVRPGNVQAFWPEANVLLAGGRRDAASDVPDYNAVVEVRAEVVPREVGVTVRRG
ncbi:MAG: formate dehydrogenase, partial [Actinobacteria bacterium]|nr:formate dehydrogenase [Actinomycetota bacterium]